jgi:sugar phosphate isomerase/epimerase
MKVGTTIRPDMGDGHIIKDSFCLIKLLEEIKDSIDFIEIYCVYPFPLNLNKGFAELTRFLKENKIDVGLHFPVEHQDRWMKKKGFDKIVMLLNNFAQKINATYMVIHPGDLTYFIDSTNREEILDGLTKLKEKATCKLVVENGITLLERAEDLDFFSKNGILISVDVCHLHQAGLPFDMFSKEFSKWGNRLFLFHFSDHDHKPHLELKKGKIKWGHIIRRIRKTKAYGICLETIHAIDGEIMYRNPKIATTNSLKLLQKLR